MTDEELVKRLRTMPTYSGDPKGPHWVPNLAADRIEGRGDVERAARWRPLEQQVFQEVTGAADARRVERMARPLSAYSATALSISLLRGMAEVAFSAGMKGMKGIGTSSKNHLRLRPRFLSLALPGLAPLDFGAGFCGCFRVSCFR